MSGAKRPNRTISGVTPRFPHKSFLEFFFLSSVFFFLFLFLRTSMMVKLTLHLVPNHTPVADLSNVSSVLSTPYCPRFDGDGHTGAVSSQCSSGGFEE